MDLVASSTYGAWIVSPKALEASAKDDKYFEAGIDAGSGPYTIASYKPGAEVVLKKYDGYWNQKAAPHFDIVDISITPDAVTAQQMLTAGEVDLATNIPLENVKTLRTAELGFKVRTSTRRSTSLRCSTPSALPSIIQRSARPSATPFPTRKSSRWAARASARRPTDPVHAASSPSARMSRSTPRTWTRLNKCWPRPATPMASTSSSRYASENPAEARFVPLIKDAFAKIGVNAGREAPNYSTSNGKAQRLIPPSAQDIFVALLLADLQ